MAHWTDISEEQNQMNVRNLCFNSKLYKHMVRKGLNYREALDDLMKKQGMKDINEYLDSLGIIPNRAKDLYNKYMNNEDMTDRPVFM